MSRTLAERYVEARDAVVSRLPDAPASVVMRALPSEVRGSLYDAVPLRRDAILAPGLRFPDGSTVRNIAGVFVAGKA